MFFKNGKKGKKRIRCWSAWFCGVMVLALLSLPYYAGVRAAVSGRGDAILLLICWGAAALAVLAAFRWEKWGGTAVVIASLAAGAVLLTGYKSGEPMLDLIVTLLLLMSGILFLQCWQRKVMAARK